MWTPDVYQGSPTPVTAFMASATKAAGVRGAAARAHDRVPAVPRPTGARSIWALAVLSLLVGSIAAVVQTDVKRILAYSSIAHAGYMLIGFEAATPPGREAALFYLFVYTFMTIGSFAVLTRRHADRRRPALARRLPGPRAPPPGPRRALTFFVLAQAGIPPTGGFMAKLEVFSAVDAGGGLRDSLVIGVLAAVIAAFFYLRIAFTLVTSPDDDTAVAATLEAPRRIDAFSGFVLFVTALLVLAVGLVPGSFIHFARDATFFL